MLNKLTKYTQMKSGFFTKSYVTISNRKSSKTEIKNYKQKIEEQKSSKDLSLDMRSALIEGYAIIIGITHKIYPLMTMDEIQNEMIESIPDLANDEHFKNLYPIAYSFHTTRLDLGIELSKFDRITELDLANQENKS